MEIVLDKATTTYYIVVNEICLKITEKLALSIIRIGELKKSPESNKTSLTIYKNKTK